MAKKFSMGIKNADFKSVKKMVKLHPKKGIYKKEEGKYGVFFIFLMLLLKHLVSNFVG